MHSYRLIQSYYREYGILMEEGKPGGYVERGLISCLDKLLVGPLLASILTQQTHTQGNSRDH